jgi:hypothetical protein
MSSFLFKYKQFNWNYELQMTLMEKRIGSKENLLSIDEFKEGLDLRYERLS